MTAQYRVRRALTEAEMTRIYSAIKAADSTVAILDATVKTVFTTLLAPLKESLEDYTKTRKLNPSAFAIPQTQWQTITDACLSRADAFGYRAEMALDLVNVMPCSYEDASVVVPPVPAVDQRPYEHVLTVTRDASDVIVAASDLCAALGDYFGEGSRQCQAAVRSWQRAISAVFSMAFGACAHISRHGKLSLLVQASSGYTYGIIFNPVERCCTRPECQAVIDEDGQTLPEQSSGPVCPDGRHTPSYPRDAPTPGTWSLHS